ncbi:aldehyde dehydrogenase family protein [Vallicoccus soli]|uniref:Aldehyde dehydrogenase n=1 Tax=Vallicoccus soli TaxID=2339232 RepID=A0A3A3Z0E5_9ACTN|nr:aldehyde dehydrogenase family protein [Vallicoccus soli]RJK93812.1 aldehyde dehydrogenase [Vallicoccus soli]
MPEQPTAPLRPVDPATGEPLPEVAVTGAPEVRAAVAAARAAAPGWRRTPPAERAAALRRVADRVREQADELARWTTREMGKPLGDARGGVEAAIGTIEQYAQLGPVHRGRSLLGAPGATDLMVPEPRGVVGVITPWNDPVAVAAGLLAAALVTGNTVVHKPSERTTSTGLALAACFAAELPADVLRVVTGDGATGAALASADLDLVAHVGSTATGRSIARAAAATGAAVLLENGGNDPLVVDAGVDPAWAAEQAALGSFANAGQICTSVERIYVHADVADAFLDELAARARDAVVGPGLDPATTVGPLVDARHREGVHRHVEDALERGAKALVGGELPHGEGAYYPPTVLVGCTPEMLVMREETFGPVAPVQVVPSFDAALEAACEGPYGLAAVILTADMEHAQRAWRELPVGTVKVNAAFGGAPGGAAQPRGASGAGFGYGPELLDEMTTTKVVHVEPAPAPRG